MLKINKVYKGLCHDGGMVLFEVKEINVSVQGVTSYKGSALVGCYKFELTGINPLGYKELKEASAEEVEQFNNEL
jgi:hypothetical protein